MIINNVNITGQQSMITPEELKKIHNADKTIISHIENSRKIISDIIQWVDERLLVIVGPCSIHNTEEWLEYAKKIVEMKAKCPNLFIVMRTYFEKPRTTVGWKWLINDPDLDWTFNINKWIQKAREFILEVNSLWLPTATEFLDNMTPTDIADLVSWWAIWARTTESQLHRELASWLSMPIWFKNWTNWDRLIALDAIVSASNKHSFLWINDKWERTIINAKWNQDWHIILRWWKWITNYDEKSINETIKLLEEKDIKTWIIVDCSHANSEKDHDKQKTVTTEIARQISEWNKKIVWIMIESNINAWSQSFNPKKDNYEKLQRWVSITDACIPLYDTEKIFTKLSKSAWNRRKINKAT